MNPWSRQHASWQSTLAAEGGRAGLNTVTWDGRTVTGQTAANGFYTGLIIDKDENRVLDKFSLVVQQ